MYLWPGSTFRVTVFEKERERSKEEVAGVALVLTAPASE